MAELCSFRCHWPGAGAMPYPATLGTFRARRLPLETETERSQLFRKRTNNASVGFAMLLAEAGQRDRYRNRAFSSSSYMPGLQSEILATVPSSSGEWDTCLLNAAAVTHERFTFQTELSCLRGPKEPTWASALLQPTSMASAACEVRWAMMGVACTRQQLQLLAFVGLTCTWLIDVCWQHSGSERPCLSVEASSHKHGMRFCCGSNTVLPHLSELCPFVGSSWYYLDRAGTWYLAQKIMSGMVCTWQV